LEEEQKPTSATKTARKRQKRLHQLTEAINTTSTSHYCKFLKQGTVGGIYRRQQKRGRVGGLLITKRKKQKVGRGENVHTSQECNPVHHLYIRECE